MTLLLSVATEAARPYSRYNWKQLTDKVTSSCIGSRQKAYAIFNWICDNIAYDVDYRIYHADEAMAAGKGVCQAYAEIFYLMCEAAGVKAEIVVGNAHEEGGGMVGHAWNFVYVTGNSGFFVDSCWGAGGVGSGKFYKQKKDYWFNVPPAWLIFTHIPDNKAFQFLPSPITDEQFRRLPDINPTMRYCKINGQALLEKCLREPGYKPDFPDYWHQLRLSILPREIPLNGTLHVGTPYKFSITHPAASKIAVCNGTDWTELQKRSESAQTDIVFVPSAAGNLQVVFAEGDKYSVLLKYKVAAPTSADHANLERNHPAKALVLTSAKNYNAGIYSRYFPDMAKVVAEVKRGRISELPLLYDCQIDYRAIDIPLNGRLKAGRPASFRIAPGVGEWVVIEGDSWHSDWRPTASGRELEITVTPKSRGKLKLCCRRKGAGGNYYTAVEYTVD